MSTPARPSVAAARLGPTVMVKGARVVEHKDEVDVSGKVFVCYVIAVTGSSGVDGDGEDVQWIVRKRYTEFYQFYQGLYVVAKNIPAVLAYKFPHKSLFHNHDPRTIERRKAGFEELMMLALVAQPTLLSEFLQVSAPELCGQSSESPSRTSSWSPEISSSTVAPASPLAPVAIALNGGLDSTVPVMQPIPEDEPVEFSRALLRIKRVEATNLKKVELLGNNDPFVTLAFDKWRGRTKTRDNAGCNVSWELAGDHKFECTVTTDSLERLQLRVAAHDDNDISSSKEIGKGAMSLSDVLTRGFDVESTVTVDLVDSKQRPAGRVVVVYDIVEHPDDVADNERKIHENGVLFALFYIILYEACLLVYVLITFDYESLPSLLLLKVKKELLRLMFCSQLLLILGIAFLFFHRFLGWALTAYLNSAMGTPSGGYNMELKWLSLRLGLDESEIVLKDFTWHNPPVFKESQYFVKIKRMCIRFDPASIYPALTRNTPIHISDIEISGVTAYVERDPKHGLNIWACMGAADQPENNKIESSVVGNVSSAMKKSKKNQDKQLGDGALLKNRRKAKAASGGQSGDEDDFEEDVMDEAVAAAPEILRQASDNSVAGGEPEKTSGWGVPYKFITGRLEIRNLRAHAQDYLNARHTSYSNLTSIRIKRMDMNKKELCNYSSSKGYRGVFLDDLVWKLIGELITSLLASNSGSLALLAASAAANNTFALAMGTTGLASKGVMESLHNYNPKEVMGTTFRRTSSLFKAQANVEQDEELKQLGFNTVTGRIISVRNLKRKGHKVDSLYCTLSLIGSEAFDHGSYKSYVRSGNDDLTASFNEKFDLGPLNSLSQTIAIKLFDKKLARVVTSDKLIVEGLIPNLRDETFVGRGSEVVRWIELDSEGMFEDTGEIQLALQLKKK